MAARIRYEVVVLPFVPETRRRGCVNVGTQLRNDSSRVGHLHDGHAQASFTRLRAPILICENHACPGLDRRVSETDAVLLEAGNRDEQPVRLAVVGGHGDAAKAQRRVRNRRGAAIRGEKSVDLQARQCGR